MRAKHRARKLRVESLEHRALLDGNLAVSVRDGTLWITGDAQPNGVTVEVLGSSVAPDGSVSPPGSLRITPDAATTLNRGKPGEPLVFSGVTVGARVSLGDGDDLLGLVGTQGQSLGSLSVSTGTGDDTVEVSSLSTRSMSVVYLGGLDFSMDQSSVDADLYLKYAGLPVAAPFSAAIQDSQVGGLLSVSSRTGGDISLQRVHSGGGFIKMGGSDFRSSVLLKSTEFSQKLDLRAVGDVDVSLDACRAAAAFIKFDGVDGESSLSLQDVSVDGLLSVSSKVSVQDLSLSRVHAADIFLKFETPSSSSSRCVIADSDADGMLDLRSTGSLDVSLEACRASEAYIKIDGIKGEFATSSASFSDITITGGLSVSSSNAAPDFSFSGVRASNMFLKIDGIKGELAASSASLSDITITGGLSVSSSNTAPDFSFSSVRASNLFLKIDGVKGESVAGSTSLDDVAVSGGLSVSSKLVVQDSSFSRVHAADIFLKFETPSSSSSRCVIADTDADGAIDLQSIGALDVSFDTGRASGFYMKFDGIKGESSVCSTSLNNLVVTGPLSVSSKVSVQDLSLSIVHAADILLKFQTPSSSSSRCELVDTESDGTLDVQSVGPLDVSLDTCRAAGAFLKFDGIKGESVASSARLDGVEIAGGLSVSSRVAVQDLSVSRVSASGMSIKLECPAQMPSRCVVTDSDVEQSLDVQSTGRLDVSLEACRATDVHIKMQAASGQVSRSSVSLVDLDLDGSLDVYSRGSLDFSVASSGETGADGSVAPALRAIDLVLRVVDFAGAPPSSCDVSLDDIVLSGRLQATCGNGDCLVSLTDSTVQGSTLLTAGRGNGDQLLLSNVKLASPVTITGFESVATT